MKTMKMPRLSTGSVHLWNDKMSRSVARSLAFRLHRLLPVIAARVAWTHLWSSRMMKKSTQTLCCWPLRPKLGMKNQTMKKLRKDTIRLIMIKPKFESLCLCVSFSFYVIEFPPHGCKPQHGWPSGKVQCFLKVYLSRTYLWNLVYTQITVAYLIN